jgi:hypothetical protein
MFMTFNTKRLPLFPLMHFGKINSICGQEHFIRYFSAETVFFFVEMREIEGLLP